MPRAGEHSRSAIAMPDGRQRRIGVCWPTEASARRAAGSRPRAWRSAFEHASSAAGSMRRPIADGGHPPKLRIAGCLALSRLGARAGAAA